jgi:hypothetical protein
MTHGVEHRRGGRRRHVLGEEEVALVPCKDELSSAFGSACVTCLYRAEIASAMAYTK